LMRFILSFSNADNFTVLAIAGALIG